MRLSINILLCLRQQSALIPNMASWNSNIHRRHYRLLFLYRAVHKNGDWFSTPLQVELHCNNIASCYMWSLYTACGGIFACRISTIAVLTSYRQPLMTVNASHNRSLAQCQHSTPPFHTCQCEFVSYAHHVSVTAPLYGWQSKTYCALLSASCRCLRHQIAADLSLLQTSGKGLYSRWTIDMLNELVLRITYRTCCILEKLFHILFFLWTENISLIAQDAPKTVITGKQIPLPRYLGKDCQIAGFAAHGEYIVPYVIR